MLTVAVTSDDGKPLPIGTYVHVTGANSANQLMVKVYSGFNTTATIPCGSFHSQPALVNQTDAKDKVLGPRDDVYQQYDNPLWGPAGPQPEDADTQGAIGDCYFISSMGAVCRSNPEAIKALISPHTPASTYSVHFYERVKGEMKATQTYSVDTWLPTLRKSDHSQAYGGGIALWVSILEKAWALHKGSYDTIQGGWPAQAMAALTGVKSDLVKTTGTDGKGGGLIDQFRQMEKEHRAVCIGTKDDADRKSIGWTKDKFAAEGDTLKAQLDPSLVFESVQVYGPSFVGKDDSNNNILQSSGTAKLKRGSVNYQAGTVELQFDPSTKPEAKELQAAWTHCGPDFQKYGLVGCHAYRFTGVREPDAIGLANPWGQQDPKPVDAPGIARLFSQVASNAVPGAAGARASTRTGESDAGAGAGS